MEIRKYKRRGYKAERDLMKKLRSKKIWSWRIPSSGFKTAGYALPDILGVIRGRIIAFEVKTTEKDKFNLTLKDNDPIIFWLQNSLEYPLEARGFLTTKFIGNNRWCGKEIYNLEKNEKRKFEFKRSDAVTLNELLRSLKITIKPFVEE